MSRSKALLGIALIFAFGVVAGLALSVRVSIQRVRDLAASTPEQLAAVTVYRLHGSVRFSPEQHTEALRILTEAERQIAAEQQRISPEIEAITRRAQHDIQTLLTPQQLSRLPKPPLPPGPSAL